MPEHPNVETLREGYALFNKGEMAAAMESWSDDIVWHTPGNSPIAGDYRGKQEIAGFFAKMQGMGLTSMNLEVHDILANDEHAVAMIDVNVDRGDHHYEGKSVHVWHLRDGKATEFWGMAADQAAADAFWL
jgi:ketosteroid isomerase-like protein